MNQKYLCVIFIFCFMPALLFGMVINTNQSAEYIRMMNRNASTDLDAALYNPAGLTQLEDGLFLYLSSQTIWQSRTVTAAFPAYNSPTFEGNTFVPTFPNAYFAYKKAKLAFFGGFMPIGGGGSAEFPNSLPTFDYQLAKLVGLPAGLVNEALAPYGNISGYSVDASFTGSSVYYSGQGGVTYSITDMISLAFGLRYVYANNTYVGSLENAVLEATNGNIEGVIPNIEVDSKNTGTAYTAVFGFGVAPSNKLNIGLRYELKTKLKVESSTEKDNTDLVLDEPMFPDGATYSEDIPAQFGAGISFKPIDRLRLEADFNYWFNTACDWDGDEENVVNDFNTGLGIEYSLTDALLLSTGFLYSTTGATDAYNSDLDYSLASSTLGAGLKYTLNNKISFSFGLSNTFYQEGQNNDVGTIYEEKYQKTAFVIAFGIQYKF